MIKRVLLSVFAFALIHSTEAQQKNFETKLTTGSTIASIRTGEIVINVGSKNFNVLNLVDGRMVLDKNFTDAGLSFPKACDAAFDGSLANIVVCSANAVASINVTTGSKVWETRSFAGLDNEDNSLTVCGNYVLISEKKSKGNYALTCLDLKTGKKLWALENEKDKVKPKNIIDCAANNEICVFNERKKEKTNLFRFINLETGAVDLSYDLEGYPIVYTLDENSGSLYVHNRVSVENSYLTVFNVKEKKLAWKTKSVNKSTSLPYTSYVRYYGTIHLFDDKVMLKTAGIEVFDNSNGKLLYNLPFVPCYEWGVGEYTNGIFEPIITSNGILFADRSKDKTIITLVDKNTGKPIWSNAAPKNGESAPAAVIADNKAIVQFGGMNYFEVFNNTGIGKLLDPFTIVAYDLQTGKEAWQIKSKKDFYYINPSNENIMIVGTKEFQVIDVKTGTIAKADKNPFSEDYFMTTFGLSSTHKIQKNVEFDFSKRTVLLFKDMKLSKQSF
jgi:outer membrane protein assembly factor BamB